MLSTASPKQIHAGRSREKCRPHAATSFPKGCGCTSNMLHHSRPAARHSSIHQKHLPCVLPWGPTPHAHAVFGGVHSTPCCADCKMVLRQACRCSHSFAHRCDHRCDTGQTIAVAARMRIALLCFQLITNICDAMHQPIHALLVTFDLAPTTI